MIEPNFFCNTCDKGVFVSQYIRLSTGLVDKQRRPLKCPTCLEKIEPIDNGFRGFPQVGKFSMLSRENKELSLRQRSKRFVMSLEEKKHKEKNGLF